jgi:hypothetical protein
LKDSLRLLSLQFQHFQTARQHHGNPGALRRQ